MRVALAFLMVGALWAGGAEASSFVTLDPLQAGPSPSVIMLGAPVQAAVARPDISPAKVAAAEPPPASNAAQTTPDRAPPSPIVKAGVSDRRFEIPREEIVKLSPSIIAFGEPEVSAEKVAAIDEEKPKSHYHIDMPMVIRGGVIGSLSGTGVAAPAAPVTLQQEASGAGEGPGKQPPGEDKPTDQPAAPPPPRPTGPILKPE